MLDEDKTVLKKEVIRNWTAQKHRERGDIPVIAHLLGIQKGLHLIPLKGGRWGVDNQTTSRANESKDFH